MIDLESDSEPTPKPASVKKDKLLTGPPQAT